MFTPNGDTYNDLLEVVSNMDILGFRITNRYGKTIFTSESGSPWSGEDSAAGVYYWLVTYRTCVGDDGTPPDLSTMEQAELEEYFARHTTCAVEVDPTLQDRFGGQTASD